MRDVIASLGTRVVCVVSVVFSRLRAVGPGNILYRHLVFSKLEAGLLRGVYFCIKRLSYSSL